MSVEILAIIPARGGSKSIPRKNLLPIRGTPLIAYSIGQALASTLITRTIVSTDDEEIARVAASYGAEVPFMRPPELAQDHSPDLDVFRHAVAVLRETGYHCDLVVHLRPTGPVRNVARIDQAIQLLIDRPDADSVRSVVPAAQTPYKMWRVSEGLLEPVVAASDRESHSQPRQLLPQVYWQNGYVDVIRAGVIESGSMAGERILPFIMNEPVFELDYPEDIAAIEAALDGPSIAPLPARHAV